MKTSILEIGDIETVSIVVEDFPAGIQEAFDTLEKKLDTMHGRKFYGAFTTDGSGGMPEYRACLAVNDEDEADRLGFERYLIPGGRYAGAKLFDWAENIKKIAHMFSELSAGLELDPERPNLEYYKSAKELILMSPIK